MSRVNSNLFGSMISQLEAFTLTDPRIDGVAYDNRDYDPPKVDKGKLWLRASFFPAETQQATVGDEGLNEVAGIMLVNVFYPKGKDAGVPNAVSDDLVSYFKRGTTCPEVNGYQARVRMAWRDAALPEENWFNVPVRVRYYQHVTNT